MPAKGRTTRDNDRRALALRLRREGYEWAYIGEQLGSSPQNAHHIVKKALENQIAEEATGLRALEAARLDDMMLALYTLATRNDPDQPMTRMQLEAVDRVLRIMERRAKLLGLDAPTQTQVDIGGGPLAIILDR